MNKRGYSRERPIATEITGPKRDPPTVAWIFDTYFLLLSFQPDGAPDFVTPVFTSQPAHVIPGLINQVLSLRAYLKTLHVYAVKRLVLPRTSPVSMHNETPPPLLVGVLFPCVCSRRRKKKRCSIRATNSSATPNVHIMYVCVHAGMQGRQKYLVAGLVPTSNHNSTTPSRPHDDQSTLLWPKQHVFPFP